MQSFSEWQSAQGISPTITNEQSKAKTLRGIKLSDEAMAGLKIIATECNTTYNGMPSVSALLNAIGTGKLYVVATK